jgi:uncharacterized protein (TIGR02145 family)
MKKSRLILGLTLLVSILSMPIAYTQTVSIGSQVWMAINLNVDKFRNGDLITYAKTPEEWIKAGENKEPAWCYYDNRTIQNDPTNAQKFGKLYNWYAVNDPRVLAPKGWHIPSDDEWTLLTNFLGGEEVAGKKMKSKKGWKYDYNENISDIPVEEFPLDYFNGTNESSFSGLPGGYLNPLGIFNYIGNYGYWWSSAEQDTYNAIYRSLLYKSDNVDRNFDQKNIGLSVRCLKD